MPKFTVAAVWVKAIICCVLFLWTTAVFFPGSYSVDTWKQYVQMTTGQYNDWYEPSLAVIWHGLWVLTGSYLSFYIVQMALYWVFIFLLLRHLSLRSVGYWAITVLAIFFIFIPQYLMRDSVTAIIWGIASLLLLQVGTTKDLSKWHLVIIVLFIGIGLWIRPNLLIAIIPVVAALLTTYSRQTPKFLLRWALSTLLPVIFIIGMQAFNYKILHTAKAYPSYKLKLLDIAGISKLSGTNYIPGSILSFPFFNYDTLMRKYTPASFDDFYWPENGAQPLVPMPDAALSKSVDSSWKKALTQHPFLYLQNRGKGFLYYLHIMHRFRRDEYWNTAIWIDPVNPLHLEKKPYKMRDNIAGYSARLYNTCLYDPWFWLLLNMSGFCWFLYKYKKSQGNYSWIVHACIQLSGVFYILSQFPVYQHDRDFRYSYWNVFVALIALGTLLAKKKQDDRLLAVSSNG